MTFKQYIKFVEIKTSILSLFGFALGGAYIWYNHLNWNILNAIVFFAAEMIMDNMITGINNLMDYKLAKDPEFKRHEVMATERISTKRATIMICILMLLACAAGLWLCYRTNWLMFFMGGALFLIIASYTTGPFPISRTPLGELFSGVAQGLGVPFLFIYVNDNYKELATLNFHQVSGLNFTFSLNGSITQIIVICLLAYASVTLTSNVMLANNMSDIKHDLANGRYTLPGVFGMKKAANVYRFFAYSIYVPLILVAAFHFVSYLALLTIATFPYVRKNVNAFISHPDKQKTFPTALANYALVIGVQTITIMIGALIHF